MGLKAWLNRVIDGLIEARDRPTFPTPYFCMICGQRNEWKPGKGRWAYGCSNGHLFDSKYEAHPTPPDPYTDGNHANDGEI